MDYVQVVKEAQEERKKLYGYGKSSMFPVKSGLRETRLIYGLTGRDFSLRI